MAFSRFGAFGYGEIDYGEGHDTASLSIDGELQESKDCTVYLAMSSDMDADLSQYGADLTTSGSGGYELTSTRADLTGEGGSLRSMCAVFTWNNTLGTSTIARHGSATVATSQTWRLAITASDVVQAYVDSTLAVEVALPGVSGSNQRFMVCYQAFPNPDGSALSTDIMHTLSVLNCDTGVWAHAGAASTYAAGAGYAFSVGGAWYSGALNQAFAGTLESYRLDNAYVSTAEYAEDFGYGARPSGDETETGVRREAVRPGAGAFAADEYLGQVNIGAVAEATRKNDLRLAGPILGCVFGGFNGTTAIEWLRTTESGGTHATTLGGFTYHAGYVFLVPVHRAIRRVRVRLYVASYVSSGGPQPVTLRAISSSRNPFGSTVTFGQNAQAPTIRRAQATLTVDHTSDEEGFGEWLDLGTLTLAVAPDAPGGPVEGISGSTWLALGWRFDGTDTTLQRVAIKALHVWPIVDDVATPAPGGIDTGGIISL